VEVEMKRYANPATPSVMKNRSCWTPALLRAGLVSFAVLVFSAPGAAQTTITLSGSGEVNFAADPARHFLYVAQVTNANPKHLDVINTLTRAVVGTFSFSGGGYSSQIAADGAHVFWADQGGSAVRVISVDNSGGLTVSRTDSLTLATGVAALGNTYAANLQGTGDVMKIVDTVTGGILHTTTVGSPAGSLFADTNTNLYYSSITGSYRVLDTSGAILRTLSGDVKAIDSAPGHNFVYFVPSTNTHLLQQLTGSDNSLSGKSYDFGSGASINYAAVDPLNGNVWVSLTASNQVYAFDSNLALLQQFAFASPASLGIADGFAFIHQAGTNTINLVAVPEPASWTLIVGAVMSGWTVTRRWRLSRRA
jgi:hypothetical protein